MAGCKPLKEQTIKNNFIFGAVMTHEDICMEFLELVIKKKLTQINVDKEKNIVYSPNYKGIRLDIFAKVENGVAYDIEMQVVSDATALRARYYHSHMDMEMLDTSTKYQALPEAYVIFICDYDPIGFGKYVYTIESKCRELPELEYNDGIHTILLSTHGENEAEVLPDVVKFLKFVKADLRDSDNDFGSEYVKKIQSIISYIKSSREMEAKYMSLDEYFRIEYRDELKEAREIGHRQGLEQGLEQGLVRGREQGLEQGRGEGQRVIIKNFLLNMPDANAENTSRILQVPVSMVLKVAEENSIILK